MKKSTHHDFHNTLIAVVGENEEIEVTFVQVPTSFPEKITGMVRGYNPVNGVISFKRSTDDDDEWTRFYFTEGKIVKILRINRGEEIARDDAEEIPEKTHVLPSNVFHSLTGKHVRMVFRDGDDLKGTIKSFDDDIKSFIFAEKPKEGSKITGEITQLCSKDLVEIVATKKDTTEVVIHGG